jgi:glycosyltransferase involved in cell wall biosynthesis
MRVLHVMPSMAPAYGGPVAAMHVMALGLQHAGVSVDVVTVEDDSSTPSAAAGEWQMMNGFRQTCLPLLSQAYRVCPSLNRWLRVNLRDYDLVHVHGVFTYPSLIGRRRAMDAGLPFIVRPLGILNRWGMEQRRPWVKKLFFRLVEKPSLDRASALHFTSEDEARDVSRLKIQAPSAVLPLGLDLEPYERLPSQEMFRKRFPLPGAGPVVLFLSRIDRKKGIDILLPAFKQVLSKVPAATLVIAGDGDPLVVDALKQASASQGIDEQVVWTGFVSGELRLAAFAAATVFCLPSRSENFGMALLEAMAAGLPCVSTDQVALAAEAARADAVSLAPLAVEPLAEALVHLLTEPGRRLELSKRARLYVEEHHSMDSVGLALRKLYQDLLFHMPGGKGASPPNREGNMNSNRP